MKSGLEAILLSPNITTPMAHPIDPSSPFTSALAALADVFSWSALLGILHSQLFGAGVLLMIVNTIISNARAAWAWLYNYVTNYFFVTVTVQDSDSSYTWVSTWVSKQDYVLRKATSLTLMSRYPNSQQPRGRGASNKPIPYFLPSVGRSKLYFQGKWVICNRFTQPPTTPLSNPKECLSLTMFRWNRPLMAKLIDYCRHEYYKEDENMTLCYHPRGENWQRITTRVSRPLSSIYLNPVVKNDLVYDCRDFLKSQQWYQSRGVPYRRGYLLYGPPGTGKSSFILSIAGELECAVCILNLSNPLLGDSEISRLLNNAPPRCILLLEDIDAVFHKRTKQNGIESKVTFSGLLNAIDGAFSQEGRLLFLTTNLIEVLDPALIRPGRVDKRVLFDLCDTHQAREMFQNFYGLHDTDTVDERERSAANKMDAAEINNLADRFAELLPQKEVAPAAIQAHLLVHKRDPHAAIDELPELIKQLRAEKEAEAAAELERQKKEAEEVETSAEATTAQDSVIGPGEGAAPSNSSMAADTTKNHQVLRLRQRALSEVLQQS